MAACLGTIVAARMLAGPYAIAGIAVNAPLNPEGVFGLLVVGLLLWRQRTWESAIPYSGWLLRPVPLLAMVALFPVLGVYFVSDDFILVRQAQQFSASIFTSAGGDGFFRPLGYVSMAMNAWLAGIDPGWWHASALAIHAVNSLLVAMLARRLGASLWIALLAGSLFALHGTHLEAAVWIAGRFDLLAALLTLATLLLFERNTALALGCALGALWSKEAAYILPVLLLILARIEGKNWRPVLPFAGVTALAFVYRWVLLGGIGGYREASGESAFFSLKFATTAKVVFVRLWTSLFFPINWSADPRVTVAVLAAIYIAGLLWLAWLGGTRRLGWLLAGLGASILPPLHLLGGAADLSGGRLLYLPSIWFCLFLAFAVAGLPRKPAIAISVAMLAFHFGAVRHDLAFWRSTSEAVRAFCAASVVPSDPPRMTDGVPALANGLDDCIAITKRLQ